jgi:phenylalanyl-tRNA synthetase beta chain
MKGDVEALASQFRQPIRFLPETMPALHPGKSARLYLGEEAIGWMGVLHPALAETFDIDQEVILFEVRLDALLKTQKAQYQSISKYPQVRRDLSLLVDEVVLANQIEQVARQAMAALSNQGNHLKAFYIFDQYAGEQVPKGKKSLAIALIFQDEARTLTEEDITQSVQAVIHALEQELSAEVRDGE